MSASPPAGKIQWLLVPVAIVVALAMPRFRSQPRTASEKLRVVIAFQDAGYEPCYLCFAPAEESCRHLETAVCARPVTQAPVMRTSTIFICRNHPWPLDAADQQQALRSWKDVQIEWWRANQARGWVRPGMVERAVRDFETAVIAPPVFMREQEAP